MGIEIICPIAWLVSLVAIFWLTARSRNATTRPYALPTLIRSGLIALLWAALHHKDGYFWQYALPGSRLRLLSLVARHMPSGGYLIAAGRRLRPNSSFKPNPLRGSA